MYIWMIIFKVIVIGDSGVGKSCLMNNYIGKSFNANDPSTIGVEFDVCTEDMTKMILPELLAKYRKKFENDTYMVETKMKLHIWNTSGQERFHSLVTCYYRNINAIVFCCDLTKKSTLDNIEYWMNDYAKNSNKSLDEISAVIVATKSDLTEIRQITDQDLHLVSTKYQIPYFVVSSIYDHDKIVRLFHVLSNLILDKYITNTTFKEEDLDKFRIERDTPISKRRLKLCCK
jgi:small GTP-binding protein